MPELQFCGRKRLLLDALETALVNKSNFIQVTVQRNLKSPAGKKKTELRV